MKNRKNVLLWTLAIAIYIAQLLAAVYIALVIIVIAVYTPAHEKLENKVADDAISIIVVEKYGDKFLYRGKKISDERAVAYKFFMLAEDEETISGLINDVNHIIANEHITYKVQLTFCITFRDGLTTEPVFSVSNFSDAELAYPDCSKLQTVAIYGDKLENIEFYNNPATYRNIPDVKYLQLSYNMRVMAAQYKVNWYEYWPELEKISDI